jgi:hypothetical protein
VNLKRLVALVATIVLVGLAVAGAGWKWGLAAASSNGHEQLAGWTWESAAVATDEGGDA